MSYVVVGGGILGASTAYHLAKYKVDVTLIDREDKGQASAAAAGIICPWVSQRRNKKWYQLVKHGARYYPTLIQELAELQTGDTGYKKVGAIALHEEEAKLQKMLQRTVEKKEDAPEIGEVKILSSEEVKKLFPLVTGEYMALFIEGGARVDGNALTSALKDAAKKLGAKIVNGSASFSDGRLMVDETPINADKIILTAGAWGNELPNQLDIDANVTFQKAQIMHFQLENTDTSNWPVLLPPSSQYMLAFDNGRIVAGSTYEENTGYDSSVTEEGKKELLHHAISIANSLKNVKIEEVRVGFRPYTPGHLPVFGKLPGYENIFFANGLGASGLTAGPFVGAELARLVLEKETVLDIENYAPFE